MMMEKLVKWLAGETELLEKTCPSAALSTTDPTCYADVNPGRHGGKPVSIRLTYGTANISYRNWWVLWFNSATPARSWDSTHSLIRALLCLSKNPFQLRGQLISLWLYKKKTRSYGIEKKNVFTLHIPPWAPHTYEFIVLTPLTHPRKIILVLLQIGKDKKTYQHPYVTYIILTFGAVSRSGQMYQILVLHTQILPTNGHGLDGVFTYMVPMQQPFYIWSIHKRNSPQSAHPC
jgi:hypothetical protein